MAENCSRATYQIEICWLTLIFWACGAYLALRPLLHPFGPQLIPVDFDPFAGTGPAQNSATGKGVTIKEQGSAASHHAPTWMAAPRVDPPGTKTPVYEITDKDGSAYTVDAPDENAALAAFEAIRHCKRPCAERVRIYNPATGAWAVPIQIQTPDGSIAGFPDGMATADIEAVLAKLYPLAPKGSPDPLVPAPPIDPYAAFSSPAYPTPAGRR